MKYDQLILGLIAGAALGAFVTSNGHMHTSASGAPDRASVEQIVRDVIAKEPKLILESVQKYQQDAHAKASEGASNALKDSELHKAIYNDPNSAFIGPKDAKKVVVEYFDYKCPVCKMMYKEIDTLTKKHSDVKVIFKEFPIFGPVSDSNTKLGFAVWHFYPEKYYEFYGKMLSTPGHGDDKDIANVIHAMGLDMKKLQAYADSPEVADMLKANRAQGEKLSIQGTPTLIIGDQIVPHAVSYDELIKDLGISDDAKAASGASDDKPASDTKDAE